MTKTAALHQFYSSFGLPAYEENSVPDLKNLTFPYLTYSVVTDSFDYETAQSLSLWYRDTSLTAINKKTEEIGKFISRGGIMIPCDGGAIWIKRGVPFAQSMDDDSDDMIKRKYINLTAEFVTAD